MNAQWADLGPRVLSAVVLVLVGAIDLWLGGWVWTTFVAVICGLTMWELSRMHTDNRMVPIIAGLVIADVVWLQTILPFGSTTIIVGLLIVGAIALHPKGRMTTAAFTLAIYTAGLMLVSLRLSDNTTFLLWIIAVVVATDIGGYFCGRLIGGPKLWPAVSPKKTWSGTIGGWIAALIVTAFIVGVETWTMAGAVLFASASQVGDLAQSAAKRRAGVKDSSNLIPGHGGFFDRFDGVIGAACLAYVIFALLGTYGAAG